MYRSPRTNSVFVQLFLCLALLAGPASSGAQQPADAGESVGIADVLQMLNAQQAQLDEQRELITTLQADYAGAKKDYRAEIAGQAALIDDQRRTMRAMQAKLDELSAFDPAQMSEEEREFRSRLETLEESIQSSQDSSSTTYDADSFTGSLPIPGSAAAIRIGGFVKANLIQSFDSVGSQDRFIVGTIPTDPIEQGDSQANLTVSQSRLSVELRDKTRLGALRAFVEGDFAADGDTFRLRHAFGQFGDVLAGKTWSNFTDTEASPEEIDFEGINGRVLSRRTQFRWFPRIGADWNLIASLEDPQPEITDGEAVTLIPDFVLSFRRDILDDWHVKASGILRAIEGRWDVDDSIKTDTAGWGLSLSGKTAFPRWDPRDNVLFQVNYGKGYGSYLTDLSTVGGGDAVFDQNGKLFALPVLAGYVAFQKWWNDGLRSTFIGSIVDVDTYSFQPDDAYSSTQRVSGNLIWSPVARVDLGGEAIWGRRKDKDGGSGTAFQIQLSGKYRF